MHPNSQSAPGVFLSHTHADKSFALRLAADLKSAGARVWIDQAEIKIGDSLIEKIRYGIDAMDYLAVILSPASVNSEWVRKEVDIAMNQEIEGKKVKVLPLLYRNCDLPGFLKGKLYADFTNDREYTSSLSHLLDSLGITHPASHPPISHSPPWPYPSAPPTGLASAPTVGPPTAPPSAPPTRPPSVPSPVYQPTPPSGIPPRTGSGRYDPYPFVDRERLDSLSSDARELLLRAADDEFQVLATHWTGYPQRLCRLKTSNWVLETTSAEESRRWQRALDDLQASRLIQSMATRNGYKAYKVTPNGWAYIEAIRGSQH